MSEPTTIQYYDRSGTLLYEEYSAGEFRLRVGDKVKLSVDNKSREYEVFEIKPLTLVVKARQVQRVVVVPVGGWGFLLASPANF